jgi:hypothetical protein
MGRFLKYTIEMALSGMIYIPHFIKIGSGVQNLLMGDTSTDSNVIS